MPPTKKEILKRIKNVIGHLKGVERMMEEEQYCVDILMQLNAVEASLQRLSDRILEKHLHTCVRNAIRRGDDENILEELMEVLKYRHK